MNGGPSKKNKTYPFHIEWEEDFFHADICAFASSASLPIQKKGSVRKGKQLKSRLIFTMVKKCKEFIVLCNICGY